MSHKIFGICRKEYMEYLIHPSSKIVQKIVFLQFEEEFQSRTGNKVCNVPKNEKESITKTKFYSKETEN